MRPALFGSSAGASIRSFSRARACLALPARTHRTKKPGVFTGACRSARAIPPQASRFLFLVNTRLGQRYPLPELKRTESDSPGTIAPVFSRAASPMSSISTVTDGCAPAPHACAVMTMRRSALTGCTAWTVTR